MHETDATMMTSRRSKSAAVAAIRSLSISSLICVSFSMYVSDCGDVRLGLVVVVVGDEVLDPVLREEPLELLVELRGERLVVREDERGPVERLDDLRHREGLPRPGDAEEDLVLLPLAEAADERLDRRGLVSLRRQVGDDLEPAHFFGIARSCSVMARSSSAFTRLS